MASMQLLSYRRWRLTSGVLLIATCLLIQLVSSVSAFSLSKSTLFGQRINHNLVHTSSTSSTLPAGYSKRHDILARHMVSANNYCNNGRKLSFNNSPLKQLVSTFTNNFIKLRQSLFKAIAIFSLLLFGFTGGKLSPPPSAHAGIWSSSSSTTSKADVNTVVVDPGAAPVHKTSLAKTATKLLVTAGAVSVGLSVGGSISIGSPKKSNSSSGSSSSSSDNGEDNVVPKDEPSPLPLPTTTTPTTKPKISSKTLYPPPQSSSSSSSSSTTSNTENKNPILVKDLDSKIEMLRKREELAKATAEKQRLADIETTSNIRKQEQLDIEARISAEAERVEREQRQRAAKAKKEEKEKEREEQLSQLENGKKKLQQIKQGLVDKVRDVGGGGDEGNNGDNSAAGTASAQSSNSSNAESSIPPVAQQSNSNVVKELPRQQPTTISNTIQTGASGTPAKDKEEDLELTTQIIMEYVSVRDGEDDGILDDDE